MFEADMIKAAEIAKKNAVFHAFPEVGEDGSVSVIIPAREIEEELEHTDYFRLMIRDAHVYAVAWCNYQDFSNTIRDEEKWGRELKGFIKYWLSL